MSSVGIVAALTFDTADCVAIVGVNSDPIRKGQTVNWSRIRSYNFDMKFETVFYRIQQIRDV
jgi:hypothetical protein